jgi:predicted nucleic acid-binding protein
MMSKIFLDTNVIIYALAERADLPKDPRTPIAYQLIAEGGIISVQVMNEFVDVVSRKHRKNWTNIREMLQVINDLCGPAIPLTFETHQSAVEISSRLGFRIYDSLIVAAAEQAGCTTVYTEDLQHGQTVGNVTIVNPFL